MLIKCDYCGNVLSLSDKTCPQCGSDVSGAIKKAREEEDRKKKARQERLFGGLKDVRKKTIRMVIIIAVLFLGAFVFSALQPILSQVFFIRALVPSIYGEPKEKAVTVGYNQSAQLSDRKIIMDKYTSFQYMYSDGDIEEDDGYVRVAFHFIITNTSSKDLYNSKDVTCTIDGVEAEKAKGYYRCAIADKTVDTINELRWSYIYINSAREGWVCYNVPLDARKLNFKYGDAVTINMDNPYRVE